MLPRRSMMASCLLLVISICVTGITYAQTLEGSTSVLATLIGNSTLTLSKQDFTILCSSSVSFQSIVIEWDPRPARYRDQERPNQTFQPDATVGLEANFTRKNAKSDYAGIYSCIATDGNGQTFRSNNITIYGAPYGKMYKSKLDVEDSPNMFTQGSVTVTDGDSTTIFCPIYGFPDPTITWGILGDNGVMSPLETDPNLAIAANNTVLQINDAIFDFAKVYRCKGTSPQEDIDAFCTVDTRLRVKSRLAPLWPSIGIVLEAIVLGIIIFIFEWRQKKTTTEPTEDNAPADEPGDDDD